VVHLVDRDEDRQHARHARIRQTVLMGTEPRSARMLVVDLVLEGGRGLAERPGRDLAERTFDEGGDAGVARRDVLGAARGHPVRDLLGVLAPDVGADRPRLDGVRPARHRVRLAVGEHAGSKR